MKTAYQIEKEQSMFGCTKEQIKDVARFYTFGSSKKDIDNGQLMAAMSILSDAQECIYHGMKEPARHYINKAKYLISEVMNKD